MIKYSVRRPYTVLVGIVLVLVLGVVSFMGLITDLLPSMDLPYVLIQTTYPGASPERVETTVTRPIEQAVATVSGLENVQSISSENMSIVILEFNESINMDSVMLEISGNLDMVTGYFDDMVSPPIVLKLNPDMLPVQMLTVSRDDYDVKELTTYVEEELKPYFERVEGVATVDIDGAVEDYVEVALNQQKIDEINDNILQTIDSDLYETKVELEDAKNEVDSGLEELRTERDNATQELAEASAKLDGGIAQAQAMAAETVSTEANLGIKKGQREVLNIKGQLLSALTVIDLLPEQYSAMSLQQIKEQFPQFASVVDQVLATGMITADIPLSAVRPMLEPAIAEINAQLPQLGIRQELIDTADAMVVMQEVSLLDSQIATLEQDLAQAKLMSEQLNSAVSELETAYAELESGKMTLTSELTLAESQLITAQTELESGLHEFENAQQEALNSANIDALVTQETISGILTAQNFSMPVGFVGQGEDRLTVKVGEQFENQLQLENLLLLDMGLEGVAPIRLKDVADISVTDNSSDSFVRVNGEPGILISVQKSSISSTTEVTTAIQQAADDLEGITQGLHIDTLMDQGIYIELIIDSVMSNLIVGGLIALVVLLLFLKDLRPTVIIGFSIPISLLFSIVLMYFSNVTLNIISLSGLALGVGMLVDNSIVVIENIYRLRREGLSQKQAAIAGAKQVGGAIFASTLTTVCVFLPIVFTDGISRQIFTDMGLTIAYSLFASLFVALTVVPAMASTMLKAESIKEHRIFDRFVNVYEKVLRFNLRFKFIIIVVTLALLGVSIVNVLSMPLEFMPAMASTQMAMTYEDEEATKEELIEHGTIIGERVLEIDGVETVSMTYSEGNLMMGGGSNSVTFYLLINEDSGITSEQVEPQIIAATPEYAETLTVESSNMDISALGGSGITIMVKGNSLQTLQQTATDFADIARDIEGVGEIVDGSEDQADELLIEVDKSKAAEYSLTVAQVFQEVSKVLTEETVSTTLTFDEKDMSAIIIPSELQTEQSIGDIVVTTEEVEIETDEDEEEEDSPLAAAPKTETRDVLLSEVAELKYTNTPTTINRDNQSRSQTVSITIAEGYNVSLVSRELEQAINEYDMPAGYSYEFGGENEMVVQTTQDLALMALLAVIFIYLIMVAQFQSLLSPFIVLFTIPLAFTGGLLTLQILVLRFR